MQHVPYFQGSPPRRCFVVERENFHHLEIDSEDFPIQKEYLKEFRMFLQIILKEYNLQNDRKLLGSMPRKVRKLKIATQWHFPNGLMVWVGLTARKKLL